MASEITPFMIGPDAAVLVPARYAGKQRNSTSDEVVIGAQLIVSPKPVLPLDDLREVLRKARQALRFDHRVANYPVTDACIACTATAGIDALLSRLGEAG